MTYFLYKNYFIAILFVSISVLMAKETNKRRSYDGYSKQNIDEQVQLINRYQPAGKWRRVELRTPKIVMTTLLQKWQLEDEEIAVVKHLCPWGVKDTYSKLLSDDKCKEKGFQPKVVQDFFKSPTAPKYEKGKIKITVTNTGPAPSQQYYHVFCRICESDPELLPALLRKHKDSLGEKPDVFSLIDHFDSLKIPSDKIDFIGCFLPHDPSVCAGPSPRRFLRECSEHVSASHIWTKEVTVVSVKRKQQSSLKASSSSKKKKSELAISPPGPSGSSSQRKLVPVNDRNASVQKRTMFSYSTTIPVVGKCRDSADQFAKGHCISSVHHSVNKMVSDKTAIDNYEHAFKFGLKSQVEYLRSCGNKNLDDPVQVTLNGHNIHRIHDAILDAYRYDNENSLPKQVKNSPFWSLMHDNISKFGSELNGVLLRGVSAESLKPIHAPHALRRMKGGVDAYDVVAELFLAMCKVP